jgi:Leucine-rich repeat (LRR) protein
MGSENHPAITKVVFLNRIFKFVRPAPGITPNTLSQITTTFGLRRFFELASTHPAFRETLFGFPGLHTLCLNNASVKCTDKKLEQIAQVTSLIVLNLGWSKITNDGLKHLVPLSALQRLDLNSTDVNDSGLQQHVSKLTSLQHLSLQGTTIGDVGLESIANHLVSLEQLNLDNSNISDIGVQHLTKITRLRVLLLGRTLISDAGLQHVSKINSLEKLSLIVVTTISDLGMQHVAKLASLQYLSLCSDKQITEVGLQSLSNLGDLRVLDLNFTETSNVGLQHVAKISSLRELSLSETHVTDSGLQHLVALKNLQKLSLCETISQRRWTSNPLQYYLTRRVRFAGNIHHRCGFEASFNAHRASMFDYREH